MQLFVDEVQTFSGCSSSDESEDSEDGERDDMPCSKNLDEFEGKLLFYDINL